MTSSKGAPIRLALIDDYDVVVFGVAHMFDEYTDRVAVEELDTNRDLSAPVDVALYDTFGQARNLDDSLRDLVECGRAERVVVYSWDFHPKLIEAALDAGASGYLSKALPALDLVEALESIHDGRLVVSDAPTPDQLSVGLDWPGRTEGLSERESELLALITQGKSNAEIAEIVYLSPNTIKTYIRSAYRKIGAANRVDAVLWGVDHGFRPDHHRFDDWTATPGPPESADAPTAPGPSV